MRINPDGKEWKSCSAPPRKEAARRGSRTPARAASHVSGQLRPSSLARRSRTRPSVTSCRTFHTCTDPPFSSTSSLALTSRCHPPAPTVPGKCSPPRSMRTPLAQPKDFWRFRPRPPGWAGFPLIKPTVAGPKSSPAAPYDAGLADAPAAAGRDFQDSSSSAGRGRSDSGVAS